MPSPQVLPQPGMSMWMKIPRRNLERNPCSPLKLYHFSTSLVGSLRASACFACKRGKNTSISWAILTSGWPRPSDRSPQRLREAAEGSWLALAPRLWPAMCALVLLGGEASGCICLCPTGGGTWNKIQTRPSRGFLQASDYFALMKKGWLHVQWRKRQRKHLSLL